MAESKSETTFYVTIHLDPENVGKWFEIAKPVFEKIKAEPQLVFFELYRSPNDPGAISWLEKWSESREWLFEIQLKKDYYTDYFAATEPLFVKPREIKFLTPVGSPFFHSKS
ncbi:hypothetical protein CGCS363_v004279 [Colletotrichum siamense]|uniref:uncharacterized protein n=1 Tax=Colletotrichum siamense TaxID=690259 RepID=UPI0018724662|nr:uncharacterized protein CGCS363_v004279 [Colletotrichum siamense]KAF5506292.1 hypothetical protein CGCS363_v004279 [Colletotrichum siamense]